MLQYLSSSRSKEEDAKPSSRCNVASAFRNAPADWTGHEASSMTSTDLQWKLHISKGWLRPLLGSENGQSWVQKATAAPRQSPHKEHKNSLEWH